MCDFNSSFFLTLHRDIVLFAVRRFDTDFAVNTVLNTIHFLIPKQFLSSFDAEKIQELGSSYGQSVVKDEDTEIVRVSDVEGLMIMHPDVLVSPTRIAEACGCDRRSVVAERVRVVSAPCVQSSSAAVSVAPSPALMGTLKHEFIEVSQ